MAQFPKTEPEITTLAQNLAAGLTGHADLFPSPPVIPVDLNQTLAAFHAAATAALEASAAAETATAEKLAALEMLVSNVKCDIRYAENQSGGADDQLKLLGWGAKKAPTPLQPPSQSLLFRVVKQGEGWVSFAWQAPVAGGAVAAYKVLRRERPAGPWQEVHTAVTTEANLIDQPRGKEYEFRVVALNKAGEGEASNTEMVVL